MSVCISVQVFHMVKPIIATRGYCIRRDSTIIGEIGPESSCNSHALQVIATSSRWLQLWTPNKFLEQEASLDSVPKQLTLSSQIVPVVDPNLQNDIYNRPDT